jgi:hypothetical protein
MSRVMMIILTKIILIIFHVLSIIYFQQSETSQKLDKINFIIDDLRKKETEVTQSLQATNGNNYLISLTFFYTFLSLEQISRMSAEAIMDLYPEILDPEYDPKKKKQKVTHLFLLLIGSIISSLLDINENNR